MKKYSKQYYENNGQSGDRIALGMYARIASRFVNKGTVLDYGAGNGFLSKRLSAKFETYALEISKFAQKNIKINSPTTKIFSTDQEIPNNKFSLCIALHCLEHIENPEKTVKRIAKSLTSKGFLIVVVPNIDGYGHRLKKMKWFGFKDPTHISLLPTTKWKKIINKAGLNIVRSGSDWFWDVPYLPFIPTFLQKFIFYPGCLAMVLLGRIIFPEKMGEDLVLVARKN